MFCYIKLDGFTFNIFDITFVSKVMIAGGGGYCFAVHFKTNANLNFQYDNELECHRNRKLIDKSIEQALSNIQIDED